jgi:hypothetical protein
MADAARAIPAEFLRVQAIGRRAAFTKANFLTVKVQRVALLKMGPAGAITKRDRATISQLADQVIKHHQNCVGARGRVENEIQTALYEGWQAGKVLLQIKEIVSRGHWQLWLEENFCKPRGVSYRTAAVYMKIAKLNPGVKRVEQLAFDTVRKYAWTFIPPKEEPNKHRDVKLSRFVHFHNIVNEYSRLKHRHQEGLEEINFDELREDSDMREIYDFFRWLFGDSKSSPWE